MERLIARRTGDLLTAPRVGVFRPALAAGDRASPGRKLGTLEVVLRRLPLYAPDDCDAPVEPLARGPVEYGHALFRLLESVTSAQSAAPPPAAPTDSPAHWVVRAPLHGIFYARPTPDAEPFVREGDCLSLGQPLGLIEVMKTFNPVAYEGPQLPPSGRVLRVCVKDREEVRSGQELLWIGPS